MKIMFCIFSVLGGNLITLKAQSQQKAFPNNFPEVFAGVEWNTASGLTGISYERSVFRRDIWLIGLKATHAFDYSLANMAIFYSGDGTRASFNSGTATVHLFFTPRQRGFFLYAEYGFGVRKHYYYAVESSNWFTASELGLGCQFSLGRKIVIRWSTAVSYAGRGGITATKLSVGF